MIAYDLRVGSRAAPREVDALRPRLSWKLRGDDPIGADRGRVELHRIDPQTGRSLVWSCAVASGDTAAVVEAGVVEPRTDYEWEVTFDGSPSVTGVFGTGQQSPEAWSARWIARKTERAIDDAGDPLDGPAPSPIPRTFTTEYSAAPSQFATTFDAVDGVVRARLYISARGCYRAFVNGERVGDDELQPGWTRYESRIEYQAYDVTASVRTGRNTLTAIVADGWWSGFVGYDTRNQAQQYGTRTELVAELRVDYADGTTATVTTDDTWLASDGEIVMADLLMGEYHDVRRATSGWHTDPDHWVGRWRPVDVVGSDVSMLDGQTAEPVRVTSTLDAVTVARKDGAVVVDFGQEIVGRVRLEVRGQAEGRIIEIRHGERLDDGRLYVANLRSAEARDVVVADGSPVQVFEPAFTLHGFRYVQIEGWEGDFEPSAITAQVMSSDLPAVGRFHFGPELVNTLQSNIVWSQRGNYVAVPTDCPQRDERLGWTADAQVFAPTAAQNSDVEAFLTRWLRDLSDSQHEDGCVPDVAPVPPNTRNFDRAAPGWGDAATIVPWTLYREYGDRDLLATHYPMMRRWTDFVDRVSGGGLWRTSLANNFGDWLSVDEETPHALVAAAYQIHSTDLTADAASVLGYAEDERTLRARATRLRSLFTEAFVTPEIRMVGDTQSAYLFPLAWDLVPADLQPALADRLVAKLEERGRRLTTGFHGVRLLCPVLTRIGRPDIAASLLLQRDYPSWGYSIDRGATTIWERWDGWTDHAGFQDPRMNSFNHYSLGSVGEWLYRSVAGIDQSPDSVAYRTLRIAPLVESGLGPVDAAFESPRGLVEVAWRVVDGTAEVDVLVPPATDAEVVLPGLSTIVGSGRHHFTVALPSAARPDIAAVAPGLQLEPSSSS